MLCVHRKAFIKYGHFCVKVWLLPNLEYSICRLQIFYRSYFVCLNKGTIHKCYTLNWKSECVFAYVCLYICLYVCVCVCVINTCFRICHFHFSCYLQCEAMLKRDGDFLVRESATTPGQFVLSGRHGGRIRHLLLIDPEGKVHKRYTLLIHNKVISHVSQC